MHLEQVFMSPNYSGGGIKLVDILTDFNEITEEFFKKKKNGMDKNVTRYLLGMGKLRCKALI